MGWAIGGVAAVIDSTITVNQVFHNTLWVPAHFHTYYLMGVVLMTLGAVYHLAVTLTAETENLKRSRIMAAHLIVGGYGFMLSFYLAGADSVPRRFAAYPAELTSGPFLANLSLVFILTCSVGWHCTCGTPADCASARCARDGRASDRLPRRASGRARLPAGASGRRRAVARAIERGRGRPRYAARRDPLREPRGPGHHRPHGRRRDVSLGAVAGRAAGAHDGLHALWRHLLTVSARAAACRRVTRPAR